MKRLLAALAAALLAFAAAAQDFQPLSAKMDAFFQALEAAPVEDKCNEADFLISSCETPETRAYVCLYIFNHYKESSLMGDEAVAVAVAKKWILTGKAQVPASEKSLAETFVRFNEQSLIGMHAPEITLRDVNDQKVTLFGDQSDSYTVLFFYDTTCAPCALESTYLKRYLPTAPIPLDVVAVYVGTRESSWARFRTERFVVEGVKHYWDPRMESDFQTAYGVLKTPSIFLLDPERIIVGRKLDTKALAALLDAMTAEEAPYEYGSKESEALFDGIFAAFGDVKASDVLETAKYIEKKTLGSDNPAGYAHTMGDLLYYLSFRRSEAYKEALTPLIEQYIYGKQVWSAEDSLRVMPLADLMHGLLQKCPVGSPVPDVSVSGTLRRPNKRDKAVKNFRLGKLKGDPGVVVFASDSCASCKETAAGIDQLLSDGPRKLKVLVTDADTKLLDSFDLSSLPYIIYLDKKGIVKRRYVVL